MAGARRATGAQRMTKDEIASLVRAVGNIRMILTDAAPADKAAVYAQLGLNSTTDP